MTTYKLAEEMCLFVPDEWIALLRFCITSIKAPTMPAEGAELEGGVSGPSSLCKERVVVVKAQDAD